MGEEKRELKVSHLEKRITFKNRSDQIKAQIKSYFVAKQLFFFFQ